jgi:hypothetical protein
MLMELFIRIPGTPRAAAADGTPAAFSSRKSSPKIPIKPVRPDARIGSSLRELGTSNRMILFTFQPTKRRLKGALE